MGSASALNAPPMGLQWAPIPGGERVLPGRRRLAHLALRPRLPSRFSSTLVFSRRRNRNFTVTSSPKKNNKLQKLGRNGAMAEEEEDEEEIDDDAFEALFRQLEEDLKKDDPSLFEGETDDEEISEEDLAEIDKQLAEVFDMTGYDDTDAEDEDEVEIVEEDKEEDEDEDEEEQPVTLKNWQLRRLAYALKIGRRKTNIKSLAAELCLDRPIVLELLRNPPPNLLMMSAALPDHEPSPTITVTDVKTVETVVEKTTTPKPDTNAVKVPVHVMQQRFSNQKRLKKAHLQTLEDVYRRSKRPTNAMISSIVHVTNLPRKRVIKWFEDKRSEEGVPEQRIPYQRSAPYSVQ